MRHTGLVALQHVGSSWTRARTCAPCISRRILNHCTTREALHVLILRCLLGCACEGQQLPCPFHLHSAFIPPNLPAAPHPHQCLPSSRRSPVLSSLRTPVLLCRAQLQSHPLREAYPASLSSPPFSATVPFCFFKTL